MARTEILREGKSVNLREIIFCSIDPSFFAYKIENRAKFLFFNLDWGKWQRIGKDIIEKKKKNWRRYIFFVKKIKLRILLLLLSCIIIPVFCLAVCSLLLLSVSVCVFFFFIFCRIRKQVNQKKEQKLSVYYTKNKLNKLRLRNFFFFYFRKKYLKFGARIFGPFQGHETRIYKNDQIHGLVVIFEW